MAFADPVMSLKKTKRVKLIDAQGAETHAEDSRWAFFQKARVQVKDTEPDEEEDKPEEKATLPWRALEAIQSAKGEIDVILDLVELVRQQDVLSTANIQKPRTSIAALASEHALCVQSKVQQLQAAAQQLRKGAASLRDRLAKEDAFYADISRLQRGWNLYASVDRKDAFTVDLALRPHGGAQQPAAAVDLLKGSDGAVFVITDDRDVADGTASAASSVSGAAAVEELLIKRQQRLVWEQIRKAVAEEAERLDVPQLEAQNLVQKTQHGGTPELAAMRAALLGMFADNEAGAQRAALLASIGAMPPPSHSLLQRIQAMSQHHAFMASLEADVYTLAEQPNVEAHTVQRLLTHDPLTSGLRVIPDGSSGGGSAAPLLVVVSGDRVRLERCGLAVDGTGAAADRWACDTPHSIGRQQLLQTLRDALAA